jgi:hypothetical protein
MIRTPPAVNTSSKAEENLPSRSRMKNLKPPARSPRSSQQVPSLLSGPCASRAGGDAQDVHATRLDLHDEQDIQTLEEHGIDVQEVTRQDARGCTSPG